MQLSGQRVVTLLAVLAMSGAAEVRCSSPRPLCTHRRCTDSRAAAPRHAPRGRHRTAPGGGPAGCHGVAGAVLHRTGARYRGSALFRLRRGGARTLGGEACAGARCPRAAGHAAAKPPRVCRGARNTRSFTAGATRRPPGLAHARDGAAGPRTLCRSKSGLCAVRPARRCRPRCIHRLCQQGIDALSGHLASAYQALSWPPTDGMLNPERAWRGNGTRRDGGPPRTREDAEQDFKNAVALSPHAIFMSARPMRT